MNKMWVDARTQESEGGSESKEGTPGRDGRGQGQGESGPWENDAGECACALRGRGWVEGGVHRYKQTKKKKKKKRIPVWKHITTN
jgi:hypothetical protein